MRSMLSLNLPSRGVRNSTDAQTSKERKHQIAVSSRKKAEERRDGEGATRRRQRELRQVRWAAARCSATHVGTGTGKAGRCQAATRGRSLENVLGAM